MFDNLHCLLLLAKNEWVTRNFMIYVDSFGCLEVIAESAYLFRLFSGVFLAPCEIAATVHDGEDEYAVGLQAVHHAIALHDDFPEHFILDLWNHASAFREVPEPRCGEHDLFAEELGIKRRVPGDVAYEIVEVVARKVRPFNAHDSGIAFPSPPAK